MGGLECEVSKIEHTLRAIEEIYPFWKDDGNLFGGHHLGHRAARCGRQILVSEGVNRSARKLKQDEFDFFLAEWNKWKRQNQSVVLSMKSVMPA